MPERTPVSRMTPEEYLEWEKRQSVKHEYVAGDVFAMAGASDAHGKIALNLASMLLQHTEGGPCEPFLLDRKVRANAARRAQLSQDDSYSRPFSGS